MLLGGKHAINKKKCSGGFFCCEHTRALIAGMGNFGSNRPKSRPKVLYWEGGNTNRWESGKEGYLNTENTAATDTGSGGLTPRKTPTAAAGRSVGGAVG